MGVFHKKKTWLAMSVISLFAFSNMSYAAGTQLEVLSAEGLGKAYAGYSADAEPIATLANPAAIMLTKNKALSNSFLIAYLDYEIDNKKSPYDNFNIPGLLPGTNLYEHKKRGTYSLQGGTKSPIPSFAYVHNKGDWGYGIATGAHFAYELDPKEVAGFGDTFADIYFKIVNITGSMAWQLDEQWSVGVGLSVMPSFFKAERNLGELAYIIDDIGQNLAGIPVVGGLIDNEFQSNAGSLKNPDANLAKFKGDDIGYGWNLGFTFQPSPNDRFSLAYHSKADLKFEGDYKSDLPSNLSLLNGAITLPLPFSEAADGQTLDASVKMTVPDWAEFAGWHQLNPDWELNYGIRWTNWKDHLPGIVIEAEGGKGSKIDLNTIDTLRYAVGLTKRINNQWKVRGGIALDEGFVEKEDMPYQAPDSDRWWLSTGFSYTPDDHSQWDFGLAYIKFVADEIKENSTLLDKLDEQVPGATELLGLDPSIESDIDMSIWKVGVGYTKKF